MIVTVNMDGGGFSGGTVEPGDVAVSLNGRDKGRSFFVAYVDGQSVGLADGRHRKLESPKRKKLKHVRIITRSESRAAEALRGGGKVTNAELWKALADYAASAEEV